MRLWRLTKPEHAPGLDGEGARLWGGRWNSPGLRAVYTASHLSLAALEYFVHLPVAMRRAGRLPPLVAVALDVPDDAVSAGDGDAGSASLSPDAGIPDCRALGDRWILAGHSLGMIVPSRVIAREVNVVLNPAHPRMAEVVVALTDPFTFDARLEG